MTDSGNPTTALAMPEQDRIMSFFLPEAISEGLSKSGFTVQEEIELLVAEVRNANTIWAKLAALKYLDAKMREALVLSGAVKTLTAHVEEQAADGSRVVMEKSMKMLLGAANKAADYDDPPKLETKHDIIDAEYTTSDADDADDEESDLFGAEDVVEAADGEEDDDSGDEEEFDPERATAMGELRAGHFPPTSSRSGLAG